MKIRYKSITHERTEDATFIGSLICGNTCKFGCKNCFNQDLKTLLDITETSEKIIENVKSNPFNEGIILGGLEWSDQPLELLDLVDKASQSDLKVMIYTGCETLPDFQTRIGKACVEHMDMSKLLDGQMLTDSDQYIYPFIGAMMLDFYIKEDYYIKVGSYDETKLVDDNVQFGVKLASSNQRIYKIEKCRE